MLEQVAVAVGFKDARKRRQEVLSVSLPLSGISDKFAVQDRIVLLLKPLLRHTVVWKETIRVEVDGVETVLLPGACTLYEYPLVRALPDYEYPPDFPAVRRPTERKLKLLHKVLVKALTERTIKQADAPDDDVPMAWYRDDVGAMPLHALLVANNDASIALALDLARASPPLLAELHEGQPFAGESALHVLAVNDHERELCEAIDIADQSLEPDARRTLFAAQCVTGRLPFPLSRAPPACTVLLTAR